MSPRAKREATTTPLTRIRSLCLGLPEAHEVESWGTPTFRVKSKMFAMFADPADHHGNGRPAIWLKCTHVNQDLLIHSDGERFFKPPYVGPSGWIGIYLDNKPDWTVVNDLVRDGYVLTAPKRVLAQLDAAKPGEPVRKRGTGARKPRRV